MENKKVVLADCVKCSFETQQDYAESIEDDVITRIWVCKECGNTEVDHDAYDDDMGCYFDDDIQYDVDSLDGNGCPDYCLFRATYKPKEILYCSTREFYKY